MKILSATPLGGRFSFKTDVGTYEGTIHVDGLLRSLQAENGFERAIWNATNDAVEQRAVQSEIFRKALEHTILVIEERVRVNDSWSQPYPLALESGLQETDWAPTGEGVERRLRRYVPL